MVIVTPSIYGPDNSATLFGMTARGANARGVAVIDDKASESDLDAMGKAGFRGIRLNLATGGVNDPTVGRPRFSTAVERVKARGWHLQLYTSLAMISAIKDLVLASPVPVVFDHFGGAQAEFGHMLYEGIGMDRRPVEGLMWMSIARLSNPGDPTVRDHLLGLIRRATNRHDTVWRSVGDVVSCASPWE